MKGAPPEGILRNEEGDQAHLLRLDPSDRRSTVSGYTKTIGIVGGMSWASTITYYRVVCEETIRITEGKSCGSLKIISFDSSEIERIIEERRWQMLADRISAATRSLVEMGSDIVLVASNTAHVAFEQYPSSLHKQTIHIADAIADRLASLGIASAGLVGTSTTLLNLASGRLVRRLGYTPTLPPPRTWSEIDEVIFRRLCRGVIRPKDKEMLVSMLGDMKSRGAARIIVGCTEIGLLFTSDEKEDLGLLDAAEIHASVAASRSLNHLQRVGA